MIVTAQERKLLQSEKFKLSREAQAVVDKLLIDYDKHECLEKLELENLPGEIWADIENYVGLYQVSNKGRVKSFHRGTEKILNPYLKVHSYPSVTLCKNGKMKAIFVHRLVAKAFIPNPENKPEVDHIDLNKLNANAENLRWVTSSENTQAAIQGGAQKIGTQSPTAKLNEEQVLFIRESYEPYSRWYGIRALARYFNVSITTIADIVHYRNYKDVD